jgi:murein DD-endopeptidase MepM/ murein hydrolase activator NlpD
MNFIGKLTKSLMAFALWKILPQGASAAAEPTLIPTATKGAAPASLPAIDNSSAGVQAIVRQIVLKTNITSSTNYKVTQYTVKSGDSLFDIAKKNNIKPETLLWANYDLLQDSPESIRVGQKLNVPPTDGVYYKWQAGDTLDLVAKEFSASVDDILNWPGNNIDLSNPVVQPGTYVMVPGGHREVVTWYIPSVARANGTGTANVGGSSCRGGAMGSGGFIWPTGNHYLSGNDFSSIHLGIDIAAGMGAPIWAADAGVVTIAQGGWNGGYGNLVMIDHGNGYVAT